MADTREQILVAAGQLFIELGFDKTSLREVAERVGVTKAALYYYFPSKEDLLEALLGPLEEMSVELVDGFDSDDPERWAQSLELFIGWMLQHRDLFELIEHNEATVSSLSLGDSNFAATHQRFHDTVDAALANTDVPLERRVRLMCALGVAIAQAHFGRPFEDDDYDEEMRITMVNAMRSTLGLRPKRVKRVAAPS